MDGIGYFSAQLSLWLCKHRKGILHSREIIKARDPMKRGCGIRWYYKVR